MTTDRPARTPAATPSHGPVTTTRTELPTATAGFGISAIAGAPSTRATPAAPAADEHPARRSRAVLGVAALLAVVALVAAVVVFKVLIPSTPTAAADPLDQVEEVREQPGTVVGYGHAHTYGDGLEVAVNAPARYEPSTNATGAEQGIPVKLQVVVTNRTDEPFRPNTMVVTATSAGQPATAIWDPDHGVSLTGPDVSVPSGATASFNIAFAVAEPGDVRLEVQPALYGYGPMVVQPGA